MYIIDPLKEDGTLDAKRIGDKTLPSGRLSDQDLWDWYFRENPKEQYCEPKKLKEFFDQKKVTARLVTWF